MKEKPTKFQAVQSLVGDPLHQDSEGIHCVGGQIPPSEEEIEVKLKELIEEWEYSEYKRKRKPEYPAIEDQLDLLYHEGIEGWKKIIKDVKDKYPKPIVEADEPEAPSE